MKIGTYNTNIALAMIQLWVTIPATIGFLTDPCPELQVLARVEQGVRERVPTYLGWISIWWAPVSVFSLP